MLSHTIAVAYVGLVLDYLQQAENIGSNVISGAGSVSPACARQGRTGSTFQYGPLDVVTNVNRSFWFS